MKHSSLVYFLAIIGLSGCSSNPIDHFYSLVLASDREGISESIETQTTAHLVVGPIQLARYLDQPGLALQTNTSQIQTSNYHFWAEPLDDAIAKVLVRDLTRHSKNLTVGSEAGRWTAETNCRLRVQFDKFHVTSDSQVLGTGRYWIHQKNPTSIIKREFNIVQVLPADGYAHVVKELRTILDSLSQDILERISISKLCKIDSS